MDKMPNKWRLPAVNPLQHAESVHKTDLQVGKKYLKVYCRVIQRNHEGYCSAIDFAGSSDDSGFVTYAYKRKYYYEVPEVWHNGDTSESVMATIVKDGILIRNEDTEALFEDWFEHSDCDGSGCCYMYDTFIPYKIEYVEIT